MRLIVSLYRLWRGRQVPFNRLFLNLSSLIFLLAASCSNPTTPANSLATPTPGEAQTSPVSPMPGVIKVLVNAEGIYRINAAELQAAGFEADHLDLKKASLTSGGAPVPAWLQQENDAWSLYFYGVSSSSRYTATNVYWLKFDDTSTPQLQTAPQPDQKLAAGSVQTTYTHTLHVEQQNFYSPQVVEGDHWFWTSLPAPKSQVFEVSLDQVAANPQPQKLKINLYGSTETSQNPDHHAQVWVNEQPVLDERWDGMGWHTLEGSIPAGVLIEGKNQVKVNLPGDTGASADVVFLDWIEISYPRNLAADHDQLDFTSAGQPQQLTGFSGPVIVFDTGAAEKGQIWSIEPAAGTDGVTFQGTSGHHYLAAGPQALLKPAGFAAVTPLPRSALSSDGKATGADYVAIGPLDLLAPLSPLLTLRQKQGLKVLEVPLQAIYDAYDYGSSEPQAIQKFLENAHQTWQTPPRYVLLVGDATYDPRGYTVAAGANRLPAIFVQTGYGGETASDVVFVQPLAGGAPQAALGRVPARTSDQVKAFVDKVLAYEQNTGSGDWRSRVLAVADGQDDNFRIEAQSFLDQVPGALKKDLYNPPAGVQDAAQQVAADFSQGYLLIAYFGHGSLTMWGKDRIFSTEEVASLGRQNSLPVVFSFTCLNGLFTHPKVESMAEALLFQPEGGAVSVLAPTSLTLPDDQSFLIDSLGKNLVKRPALTLGEAFLSAQQQIPLENQGIREVLETFLLFGDPALNIGWASQ